MSDETVLERILRNADILMWMNVVLCALCLVMLAHEFAI